jgi:glycosyltransferase involved in cell wall biosynthesis
MYRINVISYVDAFKRDPRGGGEMINEALVNELSGRSDVDLRYFAVYGKKYHRFFGSAYSQSILHPNPDLNVLIDIYNIPKFLNRISQRILDTVTNQNYVHLDNSYVDLCSEDFLPCGGDLSCKCDLASRQDIYKNARMNFFLSPLHEKIVKNKLSIPIKSRVLRPFLDIENIPNVLSVSRDIDYLYVGTISEYKGYRELERRFGHVGNKFVFIGQKDKKLELFSDMHIPWATRPEVYQYMLRAKYFVHLPVWKEPMGRTVLEASLCGCEIIGNENVGALSFDFDLADKANYIGALEEAADVLLEYVE